ncbi:hypothetical protein KUTeg_018780 [Tegillarca granosa]|uniref:DDE-1 domain-containing protein n=1 Tax=Tegillarca granosa TaxID=220873 RepID=A0ABQ9EJG6_TEGGR|nr:hypothetical protein KUTeg_018780 [Tegillarca granosa]
MDEKGISLEHKPQRVISRKAVKTVPGKVSNCRDNITVVASVNASGKRMPPLMIVKGTTHRSLYAYDTESGPPDAIWTFQSNAWIEDILGQKWFDYIILKYCGPVIDSGSTQIPRGYWCFGSGCQKQ